MATSGSTSSTCVRISQRYMRAYRIRVRIPYPHICAGIPQTRHACIGVETAFTCIRASRLHPFPRPRLSRIHALSVQHKRGHNAGSPQAPRGLRCLHHAAPARGPGAQGRLSSLRLAYPTHPRPRAHLACVAWGVRASPPTPGHRCEIAASVSLPRASGMIDSDVLRLGYRLGPCPLVSACWTRAASRTRTSHIDFTCAAVAACAGSSVSRRS